MSVDCRLYPWPRVRETGSGYLIRARLMTPFRFELLRTFVWTPLAGLWKILAFMLVVEAVAALMGWRGPSAFLPVGAGAMAGAAAALSILHYFELLSGLRIATALSGIRVRVEVTEDDVIFRRPGLELVLPREQRVVFAAAPIPLSQSSGYMDSKFVEAVVDSAATYTLFECYDARKANSLVVNCNYAISLGEFSQEEERDPRER